MEESPLYIRCWHFTLDLVSRPLCVKGRVHLDRNLPAINQPSHFRQLLQVHLPQNSPLAVPGNYTWGCSAPHQSHINQGCIIAVVTFLSQPTTLYATYMPFKIPFSLRPMKIVEQADGKMQHAKVLFEHYEHILKPPGRTLAKDRMMFAADVRNGVEEKLWLARARQANIYSDGAQKALKTIKRLVDEAIEIRGRKDGLLVP